MLTPSLTENAKQYAKLSDLLLDLETPLGRGTDGHVWKSNRNTAIKAFERERNYLQERRCYQRLKEHQVS